MIEPKDIWRRMGYRNQLKKMTEEVFELCESISDFENETGGIGHVVEEVADVSLMVREVIEYYGINSSEVVSVMCDKLKRTEERMFQDEPCRAEEIVNGYDGTRLALTSCGNIRKIDGSGYCSWCGRRVVN